jgi:hypothetical protein
MTLVANGGIGLLSRGEFQYVSRFIGDGRHNNGTGPSPADLTDFKTSPHSMGRRPALTTARLT